MAATQATIRQVREERRGDVPLFVHPEWEREFPWLVQGTTSRDAGNFSAFGDQPASVVQAQWRKLRAAVGCHSAVLGRQVHGARVLRHGAFRGGWLIANDSDGHITAERGLLLAVSVADCVPVFVVDAEQHSVAVLHAGWRGTAAGIVRNCFKLMDTSVHVHLGPAICGECYEVGPEVHSALGLPVPIRNTPVDLRAVLARQCIESGIRVENVSESSWCTRCGAPPFFSHRGGDPERQVGVIGIK